MNQKPTNENLFFDDVRQFQVITDAAQDQQSRLSQWRVSLVDTIGSHAFHHDGLKNSSALTEKTAQFRSEVKNAIQQWTQRWEEREPARELADRYGDRVILLVFGKVNAGKSSFCNFLVDRFQAAGRSASYFHLENGRIENDDEPFVEGVTETTSRIQGALLDEERLILLDTPGLLSVREENGELTKRFTDSADAVLWLTSSSSPGQVQELEALQSELLSAKPLLPVITKSDITEEDEVDGKIVEYLRNKSTCNRSAQENDVYQRSAKKLQANSIEVKLLQSPISVSAYAAKKYGKSPQAMDDAGFNRLYEKLSEILQSALRYKRQKSDRIFISFLEQEILGTLDTQITPRLNEITTASKTAQTELLRQQPHIASTVMREALSQLPLLLEQHKTDKNKKAVLRELSACIHRSIGEQVAIVLADYVVSIDESMTKLTPDEAIDFEDHVVEVTQKKGAIKRGALSASGAIGGAVLGSILPGLGTFIGGALGGTIGGLLADKFGEALVDSSDIQQIIVGTSYERLLDTLEQEVRKRIPEITASAIRQCSLPIHAISDETARMLCTIEQHKQELISLKGNLTHECH